jgi:hypothetical protein
VELVDEALALNSRAHQAKCLADPRGEHEHRCTDANRDPWASHEQARPEDEQDYVGGERGERDRRA